MADAITAQQLENGPRHVVWRFTDVSDGSGEALALKVDATSATNGWVIQGQTIVPGVDLKITKVRYAVRGMGLRIQWEATTAEDVLALGGFGTLEFDAIGGIANPGTGALPGATGSILFSTVGAVLGASYLVDLYMTKGAGSVFVPASANLIELEDGSGVWLFEDGSQIAWG